MDATNDMPITTSVPVYGEIVYGLGRYGSYEAAKPGGVIPTIEVQNKKRVPWRVGLRQIAGNDAELLDALTRDFVAKYLKLRAA
jgi:hypothetical protein